MIRSRHGAARLGLAVVVFALVAASCGNDDDSATSESTATSAGTAASSTSTAPTSMSSSTTSTTTTSEPSLPPGDEPALECGALGGVPTGATDDVTVSADADGDGVPDVVRTFLLDGSWHLMAELSSGGVTEHVVIPENELEPVGMRILGGTDLSGGDRRMELLVVQGGGANTQIVALYEFVGCEFVPIRLPNGGAAGFPVGGSLQQRSLLSCGGFEVEPVNWLFEQAATRAADDQWNVHTVGYAMAEGDPPRLVETVTQDDVLTDEQMMNRPNFRCDGLSLD